MFDLTRRGERWHRRRLISAPGGRNERDGVPHRIRRAGFSLQQCLEQATRPPVQRLSKAMFLFCLRNLTDSLAFCRPFLLLVVHVAR